MSSFVPVTMNKKILTEKESMRTHHSDFDDQFGICADPHVLLNLRWL